MWKCPLRAMAFTSVKRSDPKYQAIDEHPEQESGVADAVDDERLVGRVTGRLAVEIEADQQVRTQAHALPARRTSAHSCSPGSASAWRT